MAISHSPRIVRDGLVLALDAADRNSYPGSGTTWSDLSSTKNNGTLVNMVPTFYSDGGGSLDFDGSNDYVNHDHVSQYNMSAITALLWVKIDSPYTGTFRCLISKDGGDRDWNFYTYSSSNNGIVNLFHFSSARVGSYQSTATIPGNLTLGVWNQVGFSLSSSSLQYILNGESIFTDSSITFSGANNTYPIRIGEAGSYTNGRISNVFVYNKQLSSNEVLQNYNATKTRFGL